MKLLPASSADIPPLIKSVDHALISGAVIPTAAPIPPILLFNSKISPAIACELFSNAPRQEPNLLASFIDNPVILPNLAIEPAASSADTPSKATCICAAAFVTSDKSSTPLTPYAATDAAIPATSASDNPNSCDIFAIDAFIASKSFPVSPEVLDKCDTASS